jgi:hypothetical protein
MDLRKQVAQGPLHKEYPVSELCPLVLEYWACILQQDTCVLTQPLESIGDFVMTDADNLQRNWNMTRFLLNEERDKVCLWNSGISNELFDGLTPELDVGTSMPNKLLRVVIKDSLA